jgi:hypothetical protein
MKPLLVHPFLALAAALACASPTAAFGALAPTHRIRSFPHAQRYHASRRKGTRRLVDDSYSSYSYSTATSRAMSSEARDNHEDSDDNTSPDAAAPVAPPPSWATRLQRAYQTTGPPPPKQVDDMQVLLYDIFLLLNLVASISFWVVHRMQLAWVGMAVSEGCLLSLCWVAAGLYTGAFLGSAVDGHYGSSDEARGGPKGAAGLAASTFLNTINLRLLVALVLAVLQHRPVDVVSGPEALLPLELGLGWVLMPAWRWLHSSYTPRW